MRVLFVDDDKKLLASLRRMLLTRKDIAADFVENGTEALEALSACPHDVVVADMLMPGMDGATLLEKVRLQHPDTVRIVLSGHSDQEMLIRSVCSAHQFLSKPCSFDAIMDVLTHVDSMRRLFCNSAIREAVSRIRMLPVPPDILSEFKSELRRDDLDMDKVEDIVTQDLGLTTGFIKLVNSSFFIRSRNASTPRETLASLDPDLLRSLVLDNELFDACKVQQDPSQSFELFNAHNLGTARYCELLCSDPTKSPETEQLALTSEEAFNIGLVFDVGMVILAEKLPNEFRKINTLSTSKCMTIDQCERSVMGVTHAEMGAYLLGLWGFSSTLIKDVVNAVTVETPPADNRLSPLLNAIRWQTSHLCMLPHRHGEELQQEADPALSAEALESEMHAELDGLYDRYRQFFALQKKGK